MTGIEAACCGVLTRDADHRTSKNGKPYTLLNLQIGEGETRQYVSAIVFGDAAMKVASLERGRCIYLEGRIELSEWTGSDGKTRAGLKIASFNAEEVAKIGRRRERSERKTNENSRGEPPQRSAPNDFHDEIPF